MEHFFFQSFDEIFFQPPSISHPIVDEEWGSDVGFILEHLISYKKIKGKKLSRLLCSFFHLPSTQNFKFYQELWFLEVSLMWLPTKQNSQDVMLEAIQ